MADITMCDSLLCPMKESCYRSTAPVNKHRQPFFALVPFRIENGKAECDMYWDNQYKTNRKNKQ